MSRTIAIALVTLVASTADAEVEIELIPNPAGPFTWGQTVMVDVWFHNQTSAHVQIEFAQLDFTDSNPDMTVGELFVFDYSTLDQPHRYEEGTMQNDAYIYGPPFLPVAFSQNGLDIDCYPCPWLFFVVPPSGSFHLGQIQVELPDQSGTFRLDVMNSDDPAPRSGALLRTYLTSTPWRAYTGQITGGVYDFEVSEPIPTTSAWGILVLFLSVALFGGYLMNKRHIARLMVAVAAICSFYCSAKACNINFEDVVMTVDSGIVSAPGSGSQPVVIFSDNLNQSGAIWLRLRFSLVQLSGNQAAGTGSFLRLTSMQDGGQQILGAAEAARWSNSSAYFNGPSVLLELLAYPGTGNNRVMLDKVRKGTGHNILEADVCGGSSWPSVHRRLVLSADLPELRSHALKRRIERNVSGTTRCY